MSNDLDIMLDLETMGTSSNAAIISIGACKFDQWGVADKFQVFIDLDSAVLKGGKVDQETVNWWAKQSEEARLSIDNAEKVEIEEALFQFTQFCGEKYTGKVWGNGADFDNVILASAYRNCGLSLPWRAFNNRCLRTVRALFPSVPKLKFDGIEHDALADAVNQAEHLITILGAIR